MSSSRRDDPPRSALGSRFEAPPNVWGSIVSVMRQRPNTIFDVGVGHGTPSLYEAYPEALHVLVEPVAKFAADINRILSKYRGTWVQAAASHSRGSGKIYIEDHYEEMSSFVKRSDAIWDMRSAVVDIVTLQGLVKTYNFEGPFVIKTDVEGHDLDVLKGAGEILADTGVVVVECRLDTQFGSPTFSPIINFLSDRNFEVFNVLEGRWNEDGSMRWVNIALRNRLL